MSLRNFLRRFTPNRWWRVGKKEPLSIVLLLSEPHFFQKEEIRFAAERAWHTSFAAEEKDSKHCVVQSGKIMLMKAGPHLLNFFHYPKPYIENPQENIEWLPRVSQREAWARHRACVGVDYLNRDTDVELAYCVLASLVAELVDERCTAIYLPLESSLIPNDESLYQELQKIASSRDLGVIPTSSSR